MQYAKLNVVFLGNTKYSKIGAEIVNSTFPISAFVTIKDSPIAKLAKEKNIPVIIAEKMDQNIIDTLSGLNPDFVIVEDYGLILPKEILELPKYAPLNVHHSLLPKYRGPSPAPTAILNGDKVSGVSIIKMTNQIDAGDILAQKEYILKDDETTDSLLTELNKLGAELLIKTIPDLIDGKIQPRVQDNAIATYCTRISKQDGYFDINNPPSPEILDRMIRAYYPWPNVWTRWSSSAKASGDKNGKIVKFYPKGLVQMEGKKAISLKDFLNGYPDFPMKHVS